MLPRSPVLVTGAAGFIGSTLCRVLREAGCPEVRGLDLAAGGDKTAGEPYFAADITRSDQLTPAFSGVKTVFHLAALARDWGRSGPFVAINTGGTRNVIEASREAGVERLVHLSTLAVHPFRGYVDADESAPRGNRTCAYCTTKLQAERLVEAAGRDGWFETVIVRPGAIIHGPGDRTSFVHLAPYLLAGKMLVVDGGRHLTCYSDAENLARGLLLCGAHSKAAGEIFDINDGLKITMREYFEQVCRALGVEPRLRSVPAWVARAAGVVLELAYKTVRAKRFPPVHRYRAGLVSRDFHFSCRKAERLLGWKPVVSFSESLHRTAAWYLSIGRERTPGQ